MVQKRPPTNREEEYRQIKKAYKHSELKAIYKKDVEMREINCTSEVRAKLQDEFSGTEERNTKEFNFERVRHFMNNYLFRGPIKNKYQSLLLQHDGDDGNWSIWIRQAFSTVIDELKFLESLCNNAYTDETTQLKQWFAKTFVTNCINVHNKRDIYMSKAEFAKYCSENPYVHLISEKMFKDNPYKTVLDHKAHLYLKNREDKFSWIDRLSFAYGWTEKDSMVRWKESILYTVSDILDNSNKNVDGRTAIPYTELCEMNVQNLGELNTPDNLNLNWHALDALLDEKKLFACKSTNSMYVTSSKWYNLDTSIHDLLANNKLDLDEEEATRVVQEVIESKKFKEFEQPTEEQIQSITNSVRLRYVATSADA